MANILKKLKEKFDLGISKYGNIIITVLILGLFIYAFDVNRQIFWLGIAAYLVWIGWKAWQGRDLILGVKHQTETAIWGKPLKLFTKEELNNTKVKIAWGKSHDKNQ